MIRDRLERIRERAYALWERAGGSHGEDEHHWHQASTEIDAEDEAPRRGRKPGSGSAKPGGASAKKPAIKQTSFKPAPDPRSEAKVASKATRGHKVADVPVVKSSGTQSVKPKAAKVGGGGPAPVATRALPAKPAPATSNSDVGRKAKPGRKSAPKG